MPKAYDHRTIEKKWQERWQKDKTFEALDKSDKPPYYCLIEFPYPSGDGLHIGHVRSNTAMDIVARKRRAEGYNVLYPIGWDAFGLPTENYAVKTGIHPKVVTKNNTDIFRRQLQNIGFSFDWSREINTTDPEYYKWTQWIFLKLYQKGLAYKAKSFINWCPSCLIGLANEEAIGGICERCGGPTEKKEKEQWMLAITKYADRLYDDLETVDYPEPVKAQQRNWIGKSTGSEIDFPGSLQKEKISIFTTRADTFFGVTYLVLAPEHPYLEKWQGQIKNWSEVEDYRKKAGKKTEVDRGNDELEKTGVLLNGLTAIHPLSKEELPIWVADYVLSEYGTGAVMAVPAHDQRDFQFAQKYNLPITFVIKKDKEETEKDCAFTEEGILYNSGAYDGYTSAEAKIKITEAAGGKITTKYKLCDWIFSRQRYWGEPIPIIFCQNCGPVAVPEKDLPVILPEVENYKPTQTGESPLSAMEEWVNTKCPTCAGSAKRETDTMPNWAGSSWYWLRYTDPHNKEVFASLEKLKHWTPVNWYNGGMEHTTLHLLYSRFWHKFLFDEGLVPSREPFTKRTSHGMILVAGGEKMSKSKGNVVNPDSVVETLGADTLRIYEMFMGPFKEAISWSSENIAGSRRFIERLFASIVKNIENKNKETDKESKIILEKTIKKVSHDIEEMAFNTAISQLMILSNCLKQEKATLGQEDVRRLIKICAPFMPHAAEELWQMAGESETISFSPWPKSEEKFLEEATMAISLQVNGRFRDTLFVDKLSPEEEVVAKALLSEKIKKILGPDPAVRHIYIPGRTINFIPSLDASSKK
jgi:leucyl-tRNA synthetase